VSYPARMPVPASFTAVTDSDFYTEDPDVLHAWFTRLYAPSTIDIHRDSAKRVEWGWKCAPRGSVTIINGEARRGGATLGGVISSYYLLVTAAEGAMQLSSGGSCWCLLPGEVGAVLGVGMDARVITAMGTRTLNLRIEPDALVSHVEALTGAPVTAPPRFDVNLHLGHGPGADVLSLARLLQEGSRRPSSALGSPHVLAHLREALFGALLLGHGSTVQHLFRRPPLRADARVVKQVEEYLTAHAAEPVSIAALAYLTGVSLRSLERSFKAARGCSIRTFLQQQRLELARRRLLTAAPGTTVTQVLYASGFGHAGEFSVAYRRRFGESPSETLRRSLR
jgi:AraC-like DNA-binding protein